MKKALLIIFAVVISVVLLSCESSEQVAGKPEPQNQEKAEMDLIKGMLTYRERIALPGTAMVTVTLEDISLADAPAKIIAQQTFPTDGVQVPLDFELSYQVNEIDVRHRYNVRAKIEVDGKLKFTTDRVNAVITDSEQTKELTLLLRSTP